MSLAGVVASPRSSWGRLGSSRDRRLSNSEDGSQQLGTPALRWQSLPQFTAAWRTQQGFNASIPREVIPNSETGQGTKNSPGAICQRFSLSPRGLVDCGPWQDAVHKDDSSDNMNTGRSSIAKHEMSEIDVEEPTSGSAMDATGCRGVSADCRCLHFRDAACSPCRSELFVDHEAVRSQLEAENADLRSKLAKAESDHERLTASVDPMRRSFEAAINALRAESNTASRNNTEERQRLQNQVSLSTSEVQRFRLKMTHAQEEARRLRRALDEERQRNETLERESRRSHQDTRYRHCEPLRKSSSVGTFSAESPQALAPVIARLELEALAQVDGEEHAKLKRKLQLKWHPDKCINSTLATCVMQELQQRPEWK